MFYVVVTEEQYAELQAGIVQGRTLAVFTRQQEAQAMRDSLSERSPLAAWRVAEVGLKLGEMLP